MFGFSKHEPGIPLSFQPSIQVPGTWSRVPGVGYRAPGTWFLIPGT
jgi:hypothetical protein